MFDAGKLKFVHGMQEELSGVLAWVKKLCQGAAQPFAVIESRFRKLGPRFKWRFCSPLAARWLGGQHR
jgi:hypothetical protein